MPGGAVETVAKGGKPQANDAGTQDAVVDQQLEVFIVDMLRAQRRGGCSVGGEAGVKLPRADSLQAMVGPHLNRRFPNPGTEETAVLFAGGRQRIDPGAGFFGLSKKGDRTDAKHGHECGHRDSILGAAEQPQRKSGDGGGGSEPSPPGHGHSNASEHH